MMKMEQVNSVSEKDKLHRFNEI